MFKIVSVKLTGFPGESGTPQVHEFIPTDPRKLTSHGQLYLVINSDNKDSGIDAIGLNRQILSRLNEEYFKEFSLSPYESLQSAVKKVSEEFFNSWEKGEIAAVSIVKGVGYFVTQGEAEIAILRQGALVKILKNSVTHLQAASGPFRTKDVLLLGTKSFFETVPDGVVKASLTSADVDDSSKILAPFIYSKEGPGGVGAMVLKIEEDLAPLRNVSVEPMLDLVVKPDLFGKTKSLINKLSNILPRKNIYLKPPLREEVSPQSKKATFSVAVILLVLLAISIGFGMRQKNANDLKNKYKGIVEQANIELDQAISLASVSPERSRQLFNDAQAKVTQLENMEVNDDEFSQLLKKINESRAAILGEYVSDPEMYLDLTLLSSGFNGNEISLSDGQVFVFDRSGGRIVSVDAATKKSKVVAGPSVLNSATSFTSFEDDVFAIQQDGIYMIDTTGEKIINKTWPGDALVAAFAGNIYVLDKNSSLIYRYQNQGNTFGEREDWLSEEVGSGFTDVKQITIDGSIYVLFPNSKILKFSQGDQVNFRITGVVPETGNIDAIHASPDNDNIYLLDKAGKRVVVVDKKGTYKAQYVNDQISGAVNLVVSEADKKILLLTGDKLYSIDLKHI